jgi:hypothetical protein
VYYARGSDGLRAIRAGSSLEEAIVLAGGRNVVLPTIPRADGNGTYDEHEHAGARLTCHIQELPRFCSA